MSKSLFRHLGHLLMATSVGAVVAFAYAPEASADKALRSASCYKCNAVNECVAAESGFTGCVYGSGRCNYFGSACGKAPPSPN